MNCPHLSHVLVALTDADMMWRSRCQAISMEGWLRAVKLPSPLSVSSSSMLGVLNKIWCWDIGDLWFDTFRLSWTSELQQTSKAITRKHPLRTKLTSSLSWGKLFLLFLMSQPSNGQKPWLRVLLQVLLLPLFVGGKGANTTIVSQMC